MLDSMRSNLNHLKWVVLFPILLSFVATIFFVWGMDAGDRGGRHGIIASVDGENISRQQFENAHRNLGEYYRNILGERFEEFAAQLNMNRMAMSSLIEESVLRHQATKLGIEVSDKAVQLAILARQEFWENGTFSHKRYRMLLDAMQKSPGDFEEGMRGDIQTGRLRQVLQAIARVGSAEIDNQYHLQNDQISIDAILVAEKNFEKDVNPTDEEKKAYYEAHKGEFSIPEMVRAAYILADRALLEPTLEPTQEEINAYYEKNKAERFSHPEQLKARHILFRLPDSPSPDQEKAALEKAQKAYEEILKGKDFIESAKALTEEEGGQERGGDLGWFERGRMVPEFDKKAFEMKVGEVSEPTKTHFGYHLIKVEEHRDAGSRPIAEVEGIIKASIKREKSSQQALELAQKAKDALQAGKSPEDVAKELGLTAGNSGLIGLADPIEGIGKNASINQTLFALQVGNVSEVLPGPKGQYVFKLLERPAAHQGTYEEVQEKVAAAIKAQKSVDLAKAQAEQIKAELPQSSLGQIAQKYTLELQQSSELRRNGWVPGVGRVPAEAEAWLFSKAVPNSVIGPVKVEGGWAFFRFLERKTESDPAKIAEEREPIEKQLMAQKKNSVAQEWMQEAQKNSDIDISPEMTRAMSAQGGTLD